MATQEFMTLPFAHIDGRARWEDVKPGWHEVVVYDHGRRNVAAAGIAFFNSLSQWLEQNVDNAQRHARWYLGHGVGSQSEFFVEFRIKFRYKRDAVWFKLRWT